MRQIIAQFEDRESVIKYLTDTIHRHKGNLEITIEEDFNGVDVFYSVKILIYGGMNERVRRYGASGPRG